MSQKRKGNNNTTKPKKRRELEEKEALEKPDQEVIFFYGESDPFGEFSNFFGKKQNKKFSLHIDGREWLTSEHYFQHQKFLGPESNMASLEYAELVSSASTPNKAAVIVRQMNSEYKVNL
eukprot:TRINITY_DN3435_c0_g1_i2.p1 TRINITY_DN3435_c0_g1~~TRINITY_DN3435_c0_g1_i2.p1  ORF type:complete len:120 (+),score=25.68 TRINITY_DN3435_c0_g1_i2:375-734(+)